MVLYGLTALTVFFALDVTLWHAPLSRIQEMLAFHMQGSNNANVQAAAYPWYQPILWVAGSAASRWHPNVFFYYGFDGLIFIFTVLGLKREWSERRWLVVWIVAGMSFLMMWPTRWPQYAMTIVPPICMIAAESIRRFYYWAREREAYWNYFREFFPMPDNWFWWSLGAFAAFMAIIYLSTAMKVAAGRVGWSHFTEENSFLPDDTVYALLPLDDGRMVIATESGAAIWQAPPDTDVPDRWDIFTSLNSGLPADRVLSLEGDQDEGLWFGTTNGVAVLKDNEWQAFGPTELGLDNVQINALEQGTNGRMYAAGLGGISAWNGSSWEVLSGLEGEEVFDIALGGDFLFAATNRGVFEFNLTSGELVFYSAGGPVKDLLLDSAGSLWAATNTGLGRLDDGEWYFYTTTNSGMPLNFVNSFLEISPGTYWIAITNATSASGSLAIFDGTQWKTYNDFDSGFSGSEPLTIAYSPDGQVWIGTRTKGIDIFQLGR
jgi:hypothetical protein